MLCRPRSIAFLFHALVSLILFINCAANAAFAQNDAAAASVNINEEAGKLFERGQEAHARGDLQTALAAYAEALKLRTEFPEAEYQRGAALVSLKRLPEAETAFRRAIELRNNWTLPLGSLGAMLERSDRFAEAEPLLNRALELDESNTLALLALTDLRLRNKTPPDGLKLLLTRLRNATTATPSASLWAARGSIEQALNDDKAALASFDRALALAPNDAPIRLQRANLRANGGDDAGALEDIAAATQSDPRGQTSVTASALLDKIYGRVINDAKGRATLEKLAAGNPRDALWPARLGEFYRTSDPARALQYYRRAAEIEPRNVNYATGYGASLVQARRFAEARDVLRRIIVVAPDNYAAHANLATALYELKNYAEALPEYEWIARTKPDLAVTYFFIGSAHDLQGELPEALAAYETFLARADAATNKLEIDKVNLRLPSLRNQIKHGGIKKRKA
ncbi:MAG: tetratricopeptide repeat protein [Pyrinomonadaceae bacterium]